MNNLGSESTLPNLSFAFTIERFKKLRFKMLSGIAGYLPLLILNLSLVKSWISCIGKSSNWLVSILQTISVVPISILLLYVAGVFSIFGILPSFAPLNFFICGVSG
jgi:hypothetical protein